jgi:prepilin-type N-terminal cleavage/methylation domain-containing protein
MKTTVSTERFNRLSPVHGQPARAFTLTELLVVVAVIALLIATWLPALANVQHKGGRAQCANNLRQIGMATMIYANEYRGWLPICTIGGFNGGGKFNNLGGLHYTYFAFNGILPAHTLVPTNATPSYYQNLGYLYRNVLAGQGQILYCPGQWGTALGADDYTPLLTTDSSGYVRSSYAFNPRIVDPTNGIVARRYQSTSDLEPHKLLAVDYFGYGFAFAHFRERGWNVLFSDGSVQFSRNEQAYNSIQTFTDAEMIQAYVQADQIFNSLELDH